MLPDSSLDDGPHVTRTDSVEYSDTMQGYSFPVQFAHFEYFILAAFLHASFTFGCASLVCFIRHVFDGPAFEQVLWITTRRVVAGMEHHSFSGVAFDDGERDSVRPYLRTGTNLELAVSESVGRIFPRPTLIWLLDIYLRPEACDVLVGQRRDILGLIQNASSKGFWIAGRTFPSVRSAPELYQRGCMCLRKT